MKQFVDWRKWRYLHGFYQKKECWKPKNIRIRIHAVSLIGYKNITKMQTVIYVSNALTFLINAKQKRIDEMIALLFVKQV